MTASWGIGLVRFTANRIVAAALVVALGSAACGTSDGSGGAPASAPPEELVAAGLLVDTDLPSGPQVDDWEAGSPPRSTTTDYDFALGSCEDLAAADDDLEAGLVDRGLSDTFLSETDSSTTIGLLARNAVYVYEDASEATAAAEAIDAEALEACIAPSVDPDGLDTIDIRTTGEVDEPAGKHLSDELDDYALFGGNDNVHRFEVHVGVRGPVVVVTQFVFDGQYFEDVDDDLDAVREEATATVHQRVEDLTG